MSKEHELEPQGKLPEFRLPGGGVIREAVLELDAPAVLELYKASHAIEHLAWVTPDDSIEQLLDYHQTHPNALIFVATISGDIAGAVTILKEEGLRSAKLNRLVVTQGSQYENTAHLLLRQALSYAFSREDAGGLGCEQVMSELIQDIPGSERATRAFERVGFDFHGPRLHNRCDGWSVDKEVMVKRDARVMSLQRRTHAMKFGRDLRKTL